MAITVLTGDIKTLISHQELYKLLVEQIRELYDAEHRLLKGLPVMAEASSFAHLQELLEGRQYLTAEHIQRLENIFLALEVLPLRGLCSGMQGLIEEGIRAAEKKMAGPAKDLMLITAAERIEHYEMACYEAV